MNNYLVPPFGLLCGFVALGEPLSSSTLAGLALILGGVVLVRLGHAKGGKPPSRS